MTAAIRHAAKIAFHLPDGIAQMPPPQRGVRMTVPVRRAAAITTTGNLATNAKAQGTYQS